MKHKKIVEDDRIQHYILGTEAEIQEFFRKEPIIPVKHITIQVFTSLEEWNAFWKIAMSRTYN